MVRNKLKPGSTTVSIEIPLDYVGKEIEILVYASEEIKIDLNKPVHRDKLPEGIMGILPNDEFGSDELQRHRDELGRRID